MAQPSALLSIINRACDELTLARPTVVYASTDPQIRQMLALLQQEGRYLMQCFEWSFLRSATTFNTVVSTESYDFPTDFDRYIPDTFWDQTNHLQILGPDTAQRARWRRDSTTGSAGIRKYFRQIGSTIRIFPADAVITVGYEYISNKWALSNAVVPVAQTEFLADTDTTVFDPYLMIKGLKYRWRSAKRFDATAEKMQYDEHLERAKAKDNQGETLLMSGETGDQFLSMANVPDTGFAI